MLQNLLFLEKGKLLHHVCSYTNRVPLENRAFSQYVFGDLIVLPIADRRDKLQLPSYEPFEYDYLTYQS